MLKDKINKASDAKESTTTQPILTEDNKEFTKDTKKLIKQMNKPDKKVVKQLTKA